MKFTFKNVWGASLYCISNEISVNLRLKSWHYHIFGHVAFNFSLTLFFSNSFGQTAIFLLGGSVKSVKPVPMYVRSGDIIIMAGESRYSYHAVPCVLSTDKHKVSDIYKTSDARHAQCGKYMESARINVNVRQVLPPGQQFPKKKSKEIQCDSERCTVLNEKRFKKDSTCI